MLQQKKLIDFCKAEGIVMTSYSPLGSVGTTWGSNRVADNEVLKEIAKAKGKTPTGAFVIFNRFAIYIYIDTFSMINFSH